MNKYLILIFPLVYVLFILCVFPAFAQEHPGSVCAEVKLDILQELTLERMGFDARLGITNGFDGPLENISVEIKVKDSLGNPAESLFFWRIDSMTDITAIDGTGAIAAGAKGVVHWLIIPSVGAGGETPAGQRYGIRANITYSIKGKPNTINTWDDWITVFPQPELVIDYYLPKYVPGDDPFTPEIEPSTPFFLAVVITNVGKGAATKLAIDTAQPKIVENKLGLLVDFKITGGWVNGVYDQASLKLNFGNIAPGSSAIGEWSMICSLKGEFKDFTASYTHSSELGGQMTSLIKQINTHLIVKDVIVNSVNLGGAFDILADSNNDNVPDLIVKASSGNKYSVKSVTASANGYPNASDPTISVQTSAVSGWIYAEVSEPTDGTIPIAQIIRSDGKVLNPRNYWLNGLKIHFIDLDTTGQYTVVYNSDTLDNTPPVTTLQINDPKVTGDPTAVTYYTIFSLTATDDASGVAKSEYQIDGGAWKLNAPFYITEEGSHTINYKSVDKRDNIETPNISKVYVDKTSPAISDIKINPNPFTIDIDKAISVNYNITDNFFNKVYITVEVYNFYKQLVRTLQPESLKDVGDNSISWDGKNSSGEFVEVGQYDIKIVARDGVNNQSTASGSVEIKSSNVSPPAPVDNLTATDEKTGGTVNLDWTGYNEAGQKNINHYNIYYKDADFSDVGDMTASATVAVGTFTYKATGLTNGIRYYFAVTAEDNDGNENKSVKTVSAVPSAIDSLSVESDPAGAAVYLNGNYAYLGEYKGITPIAIPDVPTGKHVVRLVLAGYEVSYSLIEVTASNTTSMSIKLVKYTASQYITGSVINNVSPGAFAAPFTVDWNMDGKKDIIVGNAAGNITYYENAGTDETPVFTTGTTILSGLGLNVAIFVVDWNNDGKKDLLIGNNVGKVTLYLNTGTDIAPAFDSGTVVVDNVQGLSFAIPWAVDWNNDHNKDLLVGDGNGKLNIFINTGTDLVPVFGAPVLVTADGAPLSVGENAAPCVLDWDTDGKKDILIGCKSGKVVLYLNTNTDESPSFTKGTPIKAGDLDLTVEQYSIPFPVDWNNDGLKDLLTGDGDGNIQLFLGTTEDTVSPTILSTFPTKGDLNVPLDVNFSITFSERMDEISVLESKVELENLISGQIIPSVSLQDVVDLGIISASFNGSGDVLTITSAIKLEPNTRYQITIIDLKATDIAGNLLNTSDLVGLFATNPLAGLINVDASIKQSIMNLQYDKSTGISSLDLVIKNISDKTLSAPFVVVMNTILPPGIPLANADGVTLDNKPYFDCSGLLIDGKLMNGESIIKHIILTNPTGIRFKCMFQVFSKGKWAVDK